MVSLYEEQTPAYLILNYPQDQIELAKNGVRSDEVSQRGRGLREGGV